MRGTTCGIGRGPLTTQFRSLREWNCFAQDDKNYLWLDGCVDFFGYGAAGRCDFGLGEGSGNDP